MPRPRWVSNCFFYRQDGTLSRPQVQTRLQSLCLPRHTLDSLLALLNAEGPLPQAATLRALAKGRGAAASLAKEGIRHLEAVAQAAEVLGVKVRSYCQG